MVTRRFATIALAGASLAALALLVSLPSKLAPPVAPPVLTKITIATFSKALGNAPFYIAKHFGWFESDPAFQGVTIKYAEYNDRPTIVSSFSHGDLDLLFSAEIPSILIRAQGEDVRVVLVSTVAAQEILVPTASKIEKVDDLRGHSVAVQGGTSSQFGLMQILKDAGIAPADVKIVLMPATEGRAAFESGTIDAWAAWAPWVETQEVAGRGRALAGGNAVIYSVGTVRNSFLKSYPAQSQKLFNVIQKAKAWMVLHPEEAQKIAAGELGFDLPVVQRAWPKFDWKAQLTQSILSDFQAKSTFLGAQKLTRDNVVVDVSKDLVSFTLQQNQK